MDREQMAMELEGGEPQTTEPSQTPEPTTETIPSIEYFLGDKASKLPETAEFAFKHNGQMARVPASKLLNNYRQTAHLEAKLKELNDKYSTYEKEVGDLDSWKKRNDEYSKYETLQKWSEQNPEAWEYIWDAYNKAQSGLLPQQDQSGGLQTDALHRTISELRNQLGELTKWKQSREEQEEEERVNREIEEIWKEAGQFQEKYKTYGVELDETDEEGISLKGKIVKFAAENGIKHFDAAAKAYLSDTLLEKAVQMGRQEGVKGIKGDAAAGILSRSGNPPQGQGQQVDVRRMSAEDRRNAALQELTATEE